MKDKTEVLQIPVIYLRRRILFWFKEFLNMSEDDLKYFVDQYNAGCLAPTQTEALEAIDQMSG